MHRPKRFAIGASSVHLTRAAGFVEIDSSGEQRTAPKLTECCNANLALSVAEMAFTAAGFYFLPASEALRRCRGRFEQAHGGLGGTSDWYFSQYVRVSSA